MRRSRSRERRPSDSQRNERSRRRSPSRHRDSGYRQRSKSPTLSITSTDDRGRGHNPSRRANDDNTSREDKGGDKPGERREGTKDESVSSSLLPPNSQKATPSIAANPTSRPSRMNPPPQPLQPPPPVPSAPTFLSNIPSEPLNNIPQGDRTTEEKRAIWMERIK